MNRVPTTPETKVGDLLSAYPELEGVLIALAPAFEKLKNPGLRRTVARVASLSQAARIGRVDVRVIVNRLREAAGQSAGGAETALDGDTAQNDEPRPTWVDECACTADLNADSLLANGQHPISVIQPRLATLRQGERVMIHATFDPVPLTDALRERGFRIYTERFGSGETVTSIGLPERE